MKIVVIGAGSASFGLVNLGAIMRTPALHGGTLSLVDIDAGGLEAVTALARRINGEWKAGMIVESSVDRTSALEGADFVILSVAVDREECWRRDIALAGKYGIRHYGENGGPGALAHTMRNLAVVMPVFRDIEAICPGALVMNFTNPVPRITLAARRYTSLNVVGICHQIGFGYMMAGAMLADELGMEFPKDWSWRWEGTEGHVDFEEPHQELMDKLDIRAAGVNHFTWMLSVREKATGRDLYPLLRERNVSHFAGFEPLTRRLFDIFGLMPVPGDCHLVEYLPYTHDMAADTWSKYDVQMYPLDYASSQRDAMWNDIREMASGSKPVDHLKDVFSERAEMIMAAMTENAHSYELALNLPNRGFIPNLPDDAIVEVPAVVDADGIHGVGVDPLPEAVAELCRRQIAIAELVVKAGVEGDREAAVQALAIDPMVSDPAIAVNLASDYLEAFSDYLPQFD